MFRSPFYLAVLVAILGIAFSPATTQATFSVTIGVTGANSGSITAVDQGANDSNSNPGFITLNTSHGTFVAGITSKQGSLNASSTQSQDPPDPPGLETLEGSSFQFLNTNSGTVTVTVTLTDTVDVVSKGYLSNFVNTYQLGTAAGSNSNVTSATITSTLDGTVTAGPMSLGGPSQQATFFIIAPGSYTLTTTITLVMGANSSISFDGGGQLTPTPAPSSAYLALAGLPVIGLAGWLRRRKAGSAVQAV